MNKLSKDKRDKLILISFAVLAVIGVLYLFVLGAQKDKLYVLGTQIVTAKDKLGKAERLVKNADSIELSLVKLRQQLDTREKDMAPTGQYYYWFLKLLEEFRKQEGFENSFVVDITQPEFGEVGVLPKFPYRAATFTVHVNGHYQDLGRFLADFENEFPYFRVLNVQLAPETANANNPSFGNLGTQPQPLAPPEQKVSMQLKVITLIKSAATT
jgi:Tfp pilus assembly protein PilO